MTALLVLLILIAVSFSAGYGTREMISRKRRAEYLKLQPHSRRRPPSARNAISEPTNSHAKAERARTTEDITGSFQDVYIQRPEPTQTENLRTTDPRPEQPDTGSSGQHADFEESLQELASFLQQFERRQT
jgi:hypothetical protein